jgi:hypothetical protein
VVIAGDFNVDATDANRGGVKSSVDLFLRDGVCPKGYTDTITGELLCTKKSKKQPFGGFADAYEQAYGETEPPCTVVYPTLYPRLLASDGSKAMSKAAHACVVRMFNAFAAIGGGGRAMGGGGRAGTAMPEAGTAMPEAGILEWTNVTRKGAGLRQYFRDCIDARVAAGGQRELTLDEFLASYQASLDGGKPWEFAHDLWVSDCAEGCLPRMADLPTALGEPFCARFDRIWYTAGFAVLAVLAPRTEAEVHQNEPLPNTWSASDHLMLGATLELVPR